MGENLNGQETQLGNSLVSDTAIWHDRIQEDSLFQNTGRTGIGISQIGISQIGSKEISPFQLSDIGQIGIGQVGKSQISLTQNGISQIGISQIDLAEIGLRKINTSQDSISQDSSSQITFRNFGTIQISTTQVNHSQIGSIESSSRQVDITQIQSDKIIDPIPQIGIEIGKISLPSSITLQQLLSSHNPNPQNTTVPTWTEFLQSPTPFNLKIEIQDLPTGQLAEATITGYDTNNRPNSGTLTLDTDGNSLGWFIDTTPDDNTEFDQTLTSTAFRATTGAASGKYDLLTTILHELGHLNGIIRGNTAFDTHVQNINGIPTFINGGITAQLTPDGSHLDSTLYPYDLMNTSLKPGVRKLPSALNLAMIDAINAGVGGWVSGVGTVNPAHLTAGALIGITNGDFTTPTTWNTAGATNIINGTATLTEQSQKLSELTQAFIIPTGAKTLQFTIKDNHLVTGDTTKTANDAFEVALLDTNTFNPLAGTSIGLNHTDSLLNIQANGTIHKSDKVTITALGNNSSIVTIDLTQITPTTQATLYFNLLGFGARTSTVTIDDVKLFTDTQPIPVTKNDTLTLDQNTPLILDPSQLTTNDTNVTQIQIINQPTHGTLTQTPDGKLTYQPVSTYVGNDSFTYLGFGSDGQISHLATVNLTINNLPPTIETLTIPTQINEGQNIQLSATAKDGGTSDNLTYTWNLGDGSNPITGQNIAHTYTDNGNYAVTLTVTDKDGGSTQQTTTVKVDNLAPIVNLTAPTTTLNQGESLNLGVTYSDAGIKDTHTVIWNFDDGSTPITGVTNPNHLFTKAGTNNVTVTITDNDGASTTKAIQIAVANIAPTITNVNISTNINEGQSVTLTATATDPGNDTLTYNWYLDGATIPITGQTINYAFVDNGTYPVKLNVIDSNGAITTKSFDVTVNNVAPAIVAIVKQGQIDEGQPAQFTATATDLGINDTLTYSWNFGDNTTPVSGQNPTHTFADNGNYNVVLTVTDKDGGSTTQTVIVKVDNVAPIIGSIVKPTQINEGQSVAFTATATDAGINDTLTYSWNFGDNTAPVVGQNVNHTFADNGNYNVTLTLTDKDGGVTTQATSVKVDNLAPTVKIATPTTTLNQGETLNLGVNYSDPGIKDTYTITWNFGDGTTPATLVGVLGFAAQPNLQSHQFTKAGNHNVTVTVTDNDGASTTDTIQVTVTNLPPTINSVNIPTNINEGSTVQLKATASDAGNDTLTYNWYINGATTPIIGQTIDYNFANSGTYPVKLVVIDRNGGIITQTVDVAIANVAPTINSITIPPNIQEGETVQLKATASDAGNDVLTYKWYSSRQVR